MATITSPNGKSIRRTECPVSRKQFRDKAAKIQVVINGQTFLMDPKEFSTQSLGWNLNDKITVIIDGQQCKAQVGLNITLVGSKELPQS
jgi:hypothetical protein